MKLYNDKVNESDVEMKGLIVQSWEVYSLFETERSQTVYFFNYEHYWPCGYYGI